MHFLVWFPASFTASGKLIPLKIEEIITEQKKSPLPGRLSGSLAWEYDQTELSLASKQAISHLGLEEPESETPVMEISA